MSSMSVDAPPREADLTGALLALCGATYRLDSQLGCGATAEVWRAVRLALTSDPVASIRLCPPQLAVKMLSREAAGSTVLRERFLREGTLLCTLAHPNLVRGYEQGVWQGRPYLAMELLEGCTLRDLLVGGPLPVRRALEIVGDIAAVLDHLFLDGRVSAHRDIKPGNIMVLPDGHAKLVDLGVARSVLHACDDLDTGFLGTLAYMAPEQIDDAARADIRSDLYALGAVFYEMLTGSRAFGPVGEARSQVLLAHLQGSVPSLPDTFRGSKDLRRACTLLLETTLALDPASRPQTPRQLLDLVDEARGCLDAPRRAARLMSRFAFVGEILAVAVVCTFGVLIVFEYLL